MTTIAQNQRELVAHFNYRGYSSWPEFESNPSVVYLKSNNLRSLPSVQFLQSITELYLSGNCIENLPNDIIKCKFLKILEIDNNQLCNLPNLPTNLIHLNLANNYLKDLCLNLNQLCYLETLILDNNCFEFLPKRIECLKNLQKLSLNNNKLIGLPQFCWEHLNKLTHLDLDNNKLEKVPRTLLISLKRLKRFSLINNNLKELPYAEYMSFTRTFFTGNSNLEAIPFYLGHIKTAQNTNKPIEEVIREFKFDFDVDQSLYSLEDLGSNCCNENGDLSVPPLLELCQRILTVHLEKKHFSWPSLKTFYSALGLTEMRKYGNCYTCNTSIFGFGLKLFFFVPNRTRMVRTVVLLCSGNCLLKCLDWLSNEMKDNEKKCIRIRVWTGDQE